MDNDNIPETHPQPLPPPTNPSAPPMLENEPLSIKLKEERKWSVSFNELHTRSETNVLGPPGSLEDDGKWPKKLLKTSECKCRCPEQAIGGNSPRRPPDGLDDPSGKASMTDNVQSHQGYPRADRDCTVNEMDASCQGIKSGGHMYGQSGQVERYQSQSRWPKC